MDPFDKAVDLLGRTQRGEIKGWCRWCLEIQELGETEQRHQPGCIADPAVMKKLEGIRLKGARPS